MWTEEGWTLIGCQHDGPSMSSSMDGKGIDAEGSALMGYQNNGLPMLTGRQMEGLRWTKNQIDGPSMWRRTSSGSSKVGGISRYSDTSKSWKSS